MSDSGGLNPRCLIDQTRAALAGEIAPEPLVLHAALILQPRQEHDVNKRPDQPRNKSRNPHSAPLQGSQIPPHPPPLAPVPITPQTKRICPPRPPPAQTTDHT